MENRVIAMDKSSDGFYAFIDASKRASQRGDHRQAEKLLTSSLKRAEEHLLTVQDALKDILENLKEVYEIQGRSAEALALKKRLESLEDGKGDGNLNILKS